MLKHNEHLEIENKIKELLVSELKVSRTAISASSSATPLLGRAVGLDSVETMALIVAVKEEFEISVPDCDLNAARLGQFRQAVSGVDNEGPLLRCRSAFSRPVLRLGSK